MKDKQSMKLLRLGARIIATPVFVVAFGVFWLGFMFFIGPLFQIFSFLDGEPFDWKEHLWDCNEFFCEPLIAMWERKRKDLAVEREGVK